MSKPTLRTTDPDLQTRVRELEEENAALRRFTGQAAHDLQEPLRLVAGYLDLLVAHHEGRVNFDAAALAREARDSAQRMQAVVDSALEHARASGRPLELEVFPLDTALQDALRDLAPMARAARATITQGPLPIVRADRNQMTRLLRNLVSNAIKFRPPGTEPRVRIEAARRGDAYEIAIEDHGLGIVGDAARVFEPFRRAHPDIPGTGLGLSACKTIVERHGGRIWAEPTPGGGATFRFTIQGAAGDG